MKVMVIPIVIVALGTIPKRTGKGTERLGEKRTSGNHPDKSNIKIRLNTEKLEETCCHSNSSQKLSKEENNNSPLQTDITSGDYS